MLFNSYVFLFGFLPPVLVGTWALRYKNLRLLFLTLASWAFYAWWDWRFLPLMLSTTMVDYVAALAIHRTEVARRRNLWLIGSLAVNLGLLGYFKYAQFFEVSVRNALTDIGIHINPEILRVTLPVGSPRGGVLTQASVLKVTANGTNTSPVIRGVWVLENILGKPVPPPPPGIGAIEPDIRGATTIRQQLDKHRNTESCAVCHKRIDPPGFALESFDAIGGWREWYRSLGAGERVDLEIGRIRVQYKKGPSVDSSGEMASGESFEDVRRFKELLLADKDQIARCLTEKLLTYGLGRELGFVDRPAVSEIVKTIAAKEYGFRSLVYEVVMSKTFRQK